MPLKSETTVEYYFNKPYMYYCQHHDCLRVADASGDSILHNDVPQNVINDFISNYISYVLDNDDLKDQFQQSLKLQKEAVDE
jgi:hypothetical protein